MIATHSVQTLELLIKYVFDNARDKIALHLRLTEKSYYVKSRKNCVRKNQNPVLNFEKFLSTSHQASGFHRKTQEVNQKCEREKASECLRTFHFKCMKVNKSLLWNKKLSCFSIFPLLIDVQMRHILSDVALVLIKSLIWYFQ